MLFVVIDKILYIFAPYYKIEHLTLYKYIIEFLLIKREFYT